MRRIEILALVVMAPCASASGQAVPAGALAEHVSPQSVDTVGVSAVAEGWWRALTLGDTAYLRRHSSTRLTLTLSNGQGFDLTGMLRDAATHVPKSSTFVRPATDVVVVPARGAVVVTSRMQEGSQGGANTYRYLSVLERQGSEWQVVAAHSTRELVLTPRVPAQAAGSLADYIGSYRGKRGGVVRIVARDSVLALVDPEGAESRLEPIGPALFELPTLYDGIAIVRFVFVRDSMGRVSSLSRLIYGNVVSWSRIP